MAKSLRDLHTQNTKIIILETALKLFKERSFKEVTVDDIVTTSGTSKGAFYYHFKSKDDLIIYEYTQSDNFYCEIRENYLNKKESAASKLLLFVTMQAEHTVQTVSPEVMKVFLGSHLINPKMDNIITNPNRALNMIVHEIIEYGQTRGEFRSDILSDEIATAIIHSIRGIHYDWALLNYDLVAETKKIFKYMLLPGILVESADINLETL